MRAVPDVPPLPPDGEHEMGGCRGMLVAPLLMAIVAALLALVLW